ncbi:hypothetical protein T06_16611 [Trichinella sp. T6]|nr:hypothetical protein T06_16611 [Trichinella sp. T6]
MNLDFHERSEITQGTMSVARGKEVKKTTDNKQIVYNSVCLSFFVRAAAQCLYVVRGWKHTALCLEN